MEEEAKSVQLQLKMAVLHFDVEVEADMHLVVKLKMEDVCVVGNELEVKQKMNEVYSVEVNLKEDDTHLVDVQLGVKLKIEDVYLVEVELEELEIKLKDSYQPKLGVKLKIEV